MLPNTPKTKEWQGLANFSAANNDELNKIKSHLNLILLALEAIAEINSEAILQAAQDLNLDSVISDRLTWWRLNSPNPPVKSSEDTKKLDVEVAKSLVLIICYLASQHQELLRRGVSLLEQATEQNKAPDQTTLLGNYLERFINYYHERISDSQNIAAQTLSPLAWKLLIALLFYSGQNGHRLLAIAIFDMARISNIKLEKY